MPAFFPGKSAGILLLLAAIGLAAGTCWLRAPTFGFATWNVDEAIHSAIACRLLDGGVMYRDAVDQRTPLTYGVMAAVFAVAGEYNLRAIHVATALLIAGTAWLLLLIGRRLAGTTTGLCAAILYPLLATALFYQGDANAYVTEWFVAFFSSAAAWCYWSAAAPGGPRLFVVGALGALAFLSKQPGALDLTAPALTLAYAAFNSGQSWQRRLAVQWGALALGFAAPVLLTLGYYALRGALGDLIFYSWTYNLRYYGPEIGWPGRLTTCAVPVRLLYALSPWLLVTVTSTVASGIYLLARRRPAAEKSRGQIARIYLLIWGLAGLAGAAAGGRGFDHYYIQLLPPLCAGVGWWLACLGGYAFCPSSRWLGRIAVAALLLPLGIGLVAGAARARMRTLPVDPSLRAGRFINERTAPDETLFVWGYHPDLYLFSQRKPASRFVYASFLTGLIPWTNTAPERDTAYAIVPGAMETLLRDLAAARPAFIVDCSAGPNRFWGKYPLEKFPEFDRFVHEHYLPVESDRFVPQGFRLWAIKDSFRARAVALPVHDLAAPRSGKSAIFAPRFVTAQGNGIRVGGEDSAGRLRHLELWLDGSLLDSVTVCDCPGLVVDFALPEDLVEGIHRLEARALCADGQIFVSEPHEIDTRSTTLSAAEAAAFSLPVAAQCDLRPRAIFAPYGATFGIEEGHRTYFAHAPSRILYDLPDSVAVLRGAYGFRPGAYGLENHAATDGAEFVVEMIAADGRHLPLHRQYLRPAANVSDRGLHSFQTSLPSGAHRQLELRIQPGPAGNPASDWTLWSDLVLENSR